MAEQFRIADLDLYAVGDGQCLVQRKAGGAPLILPEADARLLAHCGAYRSIKEHARSWAALIEQRKLQKVEQQAPRWLSRVLDVSAKAVEPPERRVVQAESKIRDLAARGLLLARSTFLPDSLAHGRDEPATPIGALGFTTRRRPAELRRALDSYAANFKRHGRAPEIHVVDDSRDSDAEAETENMLRDFEAGAGLRVRFTGLAERESFAVALGREARAPLEIARFALLGDERCAVTTGSARNSLLLDNVLERYVLADDDGVCRLVRAPEAVDGLDLFSQNDPTQFWFFESRDALQGQLQLTEEPDLFSLHESLLGRPLGLAAGGVDLDLAAASPAFDGRIRRRGGSVRTTMAGVVGDSGVASTAYLHTEPRSRSRLTVSESFYHAAVTSRQMLRAPQRNTVSEGFLTMAGNLGIDARSLFPPFSPVQRNSDGIAGRLLQFCFPESCRGYLNWAVLHDPVNPRTQALEDWFREIRSIRFADVLTAFLRAPDAAADDPGEALQALGARLMFFGNVRPETFREELRSRLVVREASRMAHLRAGAADGVPEFYLALQQRYIDVMLDAVTRDEFLFPRDLPESSLSLAQHLIWRFGTMLNAWPRLWNAAQWLRANGRRLSRPLT